MKFTVTQDNSGNPYIQARTSKTPSNYRIVLGSPKGGCGKTSTSLFLAATLVELGQRVLFLELTEGQAPLTHAFAYQEANKEDGGNGLGLALYRLLGGTYAENDYQTTLTRLLPKARTEAQVLLKSIRSVVVDPKNSNKVMHFLPCAEDYLSEVTASNRMRQRPMRRALLDSILIALAEACNEQCGIAGWDTIILDVLPSAESTVMKAAMGVADSYALLVDMESAQPLPGWGIIQDEINQIELARAQEGKQSDIFRGLILNKVSSGARKPHLTERINRLKIRLLQHIANNEGRNLDVLTEIRHLTTLALLGFNSYALAQLAKVYRNGIPEDLNQLSERDIEALVCFTTGTTPDGTVLDIGTGSAWLAKMFPSLRKILQDEQKILMPLILKLSNDNKAFETYLKLSLSNLSNS